MGEWRYLCRVDEVPEGRGRTVDAAGARLAVVRDGEIVAVFFDRCPHAGGSLGSGWIEEGELLCPLHRWRFRLRDGRCTTMPGSSANLVESRVEGGEVWGRIGEG
ncbi:Rieske (2Fe-2S) protein [Planctomyces sp. SH-PL62]|uniref:Rieske (2Fe-2S) protein n=1 Tax=Planctomyces sp. SH-PL62 TaxID=1636152 RepID=UPI00078D6172|nr:Rieske (2Fe-2S) protein [Planctomyces sp. SH-PL62]AMV38091.1 Assimilatory nitrite reductase [NAD(P)H] small subunit [Planctomyces sp. SH-PL62]